MRRPRGARTDRESAGDLDRSVRVATLGRRERKKAHTRQVIADAAARLFAQRGYEQVTVSDVAREADVADQTVYNYFPTKEQLVTDREEAISDRLCGLIRGRPAGVTPAAAIRDYVLKIVADIRTIPVEIWPGEIGCLAAMSPTVHRLTLELADRLAATLAGVITERGGVPSGVARLEGIALAGVFQIIISEAGSRTRDGQSQARIARDLYPIVAEILDELDRWLRGSEPPVRSAARPNRNPRRRQ